MIFLKVLGGKGLLSGVETVNKVINKLGAYPIKVLKNG